MRDLGLLYASKVGALLVALFFLPAYMGTLGPAAFGVVSVVLSVQALLLVLDLGVSTLVGRDIAADASDDPTAWHTLRSGLGIVTALYVLLAVICLLASLWLPLALGTGEVAACLLGFWALTAQNVGQSALLSRRHSVDAAMLQFWGALLRAAGTLAALNWLGATLTTFVWSQAIWAFLHFVVTMGRCRSRFPGRLDAKAERGSALLRVRVMLEQGRPLMLSSIAGASVLHLDKAIVTAFDSPVAAAPYFLATSLCLVPLTALAAPVSQYFQPRLIESMGRAQADMPGILSRFAVTLSIVTLVPSALLWLCRDVVASAWLSGSSAAPLVATYVAVLLPGIAIGALGYVPYALLLARQDYRFQSRVSTLLTTVTLAAECAFASQGSVLGVCVSLAAYHTASTVVQWLRCIFLLDGAAQRAARHAAGRMITILVPTGILMTAMAALLAAWHQA